LWLLDLDREIAWVGDEGVTEARGPTRRFGAELEARVKLRSWLVADADVTISRARFRQLPTGQNLVPLAPRATLTSGVSVLHPDGVFGRLGMRSLTDRPLTEDGFLQATGVTLVSQQTLRDCAVDRQSAGRTLARGAVQHATNPRSLPSGDAGRNHKWRQFRGLSGRALHPGRAVQRDAQSTAVLLVGAASGRGVLLVLGKEYPEDL